MALSATEYSQLTDAAYKQNFIAQKILPLMNVYSLPTSAIDPASIQVSTFKIQPQFANTPSSVVSGKPIALAGDAAMQTHFFTGYGLNAGLRMAQFLTEAILTDTINVQATMDKYNALVAGFGQEVISRTNAIATDWNAVSNVCDTYTTADIQQLAQSKKYIGYDSLDKNELCNLIGKTLSIKQGTT